LQLKHTCDSAKRASTDFALQTENLASSHHTCTTDNISDQNSESSQRVHSRTLLT